MKEEYERDGFAAVQRLRERDFMAYCRIIAAVMPQEFAQALDDVMLDAGLTYEDLRRMIEDAKTRH